MSPTQAVKQQTHEPTCCIGRPGGVVRCGDFLGALYCFTLHNGHACDRICVAGTGNRGNYAESRRRFTVTSSRRNSLAWT
jgi:hypothetical protein